MNDYKYTAEKLYEHTDRGLDILHRYLPNSVGCERTRKPFRYRDEKTPSAYLYLPKDSRCWIVKDFGGETHSPIQVYQHLTGNTDYLSALKALFAEFNISENTLNLTPNKTFAPRGSHPDGYFRIYPKEKIENAHLINRFVTPEICERYNVYELTKVERITSNGKLMTTEATPQYPMFAYSDNLNVWAKTYYPAEQKRKITDESGRTKTQNFKHGYLGSKPPVYLHGLQYIKTIITAERYEKIIDLREQITTTDFTELKKELQSQLNEQLLPYVIICSGGSDGLTLASLSQEFYPVWGNSEGDIISHTDYEYLKTISQHLINLPDVDTSGIEFAYRYSRRYWQLPTVFLPKYYLGEKGKDFRDYVSFFKESPNITIAQEFKKLLNVPVCCDFITTEDKKYNINHENLYYFLQVNNFFVFQSDIATNVDNENKGILVKVDDYKLSVPQATTVRDFCIDFYIRKGTTQKVLRLLRTCKALSAPELKNATYKKFELTKHGKDFQLFFFQNTAIKVTPESISTLNRADIHNYIFSNAVLPTNIMLLKDTFFQPYTDESGRNRVRINTQQCEYMNFLINGSRVFWAKEYPHEKHRWGTFYTLNSPHLTQEEQITQEQHFLSKCYAIGYLLHRYKMPNFERFVYIVDDDMKGTQSQSNGGTGKGIFSKAIKISTSVFNCAGKDSKLFENTHIFDELNENHDVICFDDMAEHRFEKLYNYITDGIRVNPKFRPSFFIPPDKSPKLFGTFNHGLKNGADIDFRRLFFITFSSYYHYSHPDMGREWQPSDDFGHNLYDDWNARQWDLFYNFMLRCVQFYMQNRMTPYYAPMDKINYNNLKASIGDNFLEWAEEYFTPERLNTEVARREMQDDYKASCGNFKLTSQSFRVKLGQFCQLKGYTLSDIIKKTEYTPDNRRTSVDYFIIYPPDGQATPTGASTTPHAPHRTPQHTKHPKPPQHTKPPPSTTSMTA